MEKYINGITTTVGIIGGTLAGLFGGWDILLKTIVALAILDYVTGWIKGTYQKKLSSDICFKGILKKIVMFIIIAVAFIIQELMGGNIPLREIVIVFYICNEALSLLENAAVFVPIPEQLKEILLQLREKNKKE